MICGSLVVDDPSEIKSLKNVFLPNEILYGKLRPNLNKVWLSERGGICSTDIFVIRSKNNLTIPGFYSYIFRSNQFNGAVLSDLKGAQLPRVGWSSFAEIKIPLPPLDIQKEIVAEIEGYQKIIDGARQVVENYRPHIPIQPDWPMTDLCEVSTVASGYSFDSKDFSRSNPIKCIKIANVGVQEFVADDEFIQTITDPEIAELARNSAPLAFGSTKLPAGFSTVPVDKSIPQALIDQAADIFAFDALTLNPDRRPKNPNCLWDGKNFAIYDHELAFLKPLFWQPPWMIGSLQDLHNPSRHIFFNGLKAKTLNFERFGTAWETITDTRLSQYRNALPAVWSKDSDAMDEILGYIAQLRDNIRPALNEVARVLT